MRVAVIGGGASGLMAAISIDNKIDVTLFEKNNELGKKILVTGNGRCNYWNSDININHYNTDNFSKLGSIICLDNQNIVLSKLADIGIYPKIKNGYFYPNSNQASSVRDIFELEVRKRNVNILTNYEIYDIKKDNNKFVVSTNNGFFTFDKIIISTGSKACPKTGSDGFGYDLLKSMGHNVNDVLPSLVQLCGNEKYFKEWDGVRSDVNVKLEINNKIVKEQDGEIQLTDYGLSGICIFNLSSLASVALNKNENVSVYINFLPNIGISVYEFLNKRNKLIYNRTIKELLESILNSKIIKVILKESGIDSSLNWDNLTEFEKNKLSNNIEKFKVDIIGTKSFDRCQVATGGVTLNEINENTMESKLIDNLYITGELLDVDGECGGYNLAFAFITGYLAGRGVSND